MGMKRHTWIVSAAVSVLSVFLAAAGPVRGEGLSLRDAVNRALTHNPLVSEERLGVEAGSQGILSAAGKRLPRLSLDLDYTKRQDPVPFLPAQSAAIPPHFSDEFASWGVLLTLPLYQGGRISNHVKLASVRRDLQEDSLARTRNDLIANTVNSYNKILQLMALRKASAASVAALEEQVKNSRLLLEVGRIARVDLLKVEVQLANERQRLLTLDEGIATAGATLRYLMGEDPDPEAGPPPLSDTLVMPEAPSEPALGSIDAARNRPEYRAALLGVEEAELARKIALGALLPSVSATGGYADSFGFQPSYDEGNWFVGLLASVPLFDRSLHADLALERILKERADEALRAVDQRLRLDVVTSVASLRESRHRVETARQVIEQARESFRIEQEKYGSGAGTMSDLLLAQAADITAAANYTQALFDYNAALVAYRRATGTLEEFRQ
ncbi:MAG: TolC family protein [Deltaproteobacteria bacterium]